MALLFRLLLLLVVCAPGLRLAYGAERARDALLLDALQDRTEIVNTLEIDMLALIEGTPAEGRFDLYRTYDQLMGTWVQVDFSQSLLELAISAVAPQDEEKLRIHLQDHARFAMWDLDEARMNLERNTPGTDQQEYLRINDAIRALLTDTQTIIDRLLTEQCIHVHCVTAP